MHLDFDIERAETTEFGVGRKRPAMFYFVPVDGRVKVALQAMVRNTVELIEGVAEQMSYYQPSEKYGSTEYCYLDLDDPMATLFREVSSAVNLPTDPHFPGDLGNMTCYFVRLTDRGGRDVTAFRRAAYFKGIVRKPLLHWAHGTLEFVDDTVFKLDGDFDLIVDSKRVACIAAKGFRNARGPQEVDLASSTRQCVLACQGAALCRLCFRRIICRVANTGGGVPVVDSSAQSERHGFGGSGRGVPYHGCQGEESRWEINCSR